MPLQLFDRARYEGSDADERRLFYGAMTRARDWLSLWRHERTAKNKIGARRTTTKPEDSRLHVSLPLPNVERILREEGFGTAHAVVQRACRIPFLLVRVPAPQHVGFQQFLAPELGYGKAVQNSWLAKHNPSGA
jgi:DNA helicase II / ATP-dependent DNA helicase PcrA